MMSNYILGENEDLLQYQFSGQKVFNILKYIVSNQNKLDNAINMHSVLTEGKQTYILSKDDWNESKNKDGYFKEIIVSIPFLIDTTNKHNINIIISPTEEKGYNNEGKDEKDWSEETSRELYSDYNIRCIDYTFMTEKAESEINNITTNIFTPLIITFKSDDIPEYNLPINLLVLYNQQLENYNLDYEEEEEE